MGYNNVNQNPERKDDLTYKNVMSLVEKNKKNGEKEVTDLITDRVKSKC